MSDISSILTNCSLLIVNFCKNVLVYLWLYLIFNFRFPLQTNEGYRGKSVVVHFCNFFQMRKKKPWTTTFLHQYTIYLLIPDIINSKINRNLNWFLTKDMNSENVTRLLDYQIKLLSIKIGSDYFVIIR
jgi:hypothetical protein